MSKIARDYRRLPYRRVAERAVDSNGVVYFIARVAEIPFIRIDGQTREEAFLRLDEIFDDCIEAMLEAGDVIPEPEPKWAGWTDSEERRTAPGTQDTAASIPQVGLNQPIVMPQPRSRPIAEWEIADHRVVTTV